MLLLGLDIGTSSIKASVVDANTQQIIATAQYPETESEIIALEMGCMNRILKCGGNTSKWLF
jgi:xylulokinase